MTTPAIIFLLVLLTLFLVMGGFAVATWNVVPYPGHPLSTYSE